MRCMFCNRDDWETDDDVVFIRSKVTGVHICGECVTSCNTVAAEEFIRQHPQARRPSRIPEGSA